MISIYTLIQRIFHPLDMLCFIRYFYSDKTRDISIYLLNYAEYYIVIQPEKLPLPPPTNVQYCLGSQYVVSTSVVQGYHKCPYPVKK